jgi:hypothetical protein
MFIFEQIIPGNVFHRRSSVLIGNGQWALGKWQRVLNNREPGFLAVVCFSSSPTLLPPSPVSKLDQQPTGRLRKRDNFLAGLEGGRAGVAEPNHTTARKPGPLEIITYSGKWNKNIVCGDLVNTLHIFGEENVIPSRWTSPWRQVKYWSEHRITGRRREDSGNEEKIGRTNDDVSKM